MFFFKNSCDQKDLKKKFVPNGNQGIRNHKQECNKPTYIRNVICQFIDSSFVYRGVQWGFIIDDNDSTRKIIFNRSYGCCFYCEVVYRVRFIQFVDAIAGYDRVYLDDFALKVGWDQG